MRRSVHPIETEIDQQSGQVPSYSRIPRQINQPVILVDVNVQHHLCASYQNSEITLVTFNIKMLCQIGIYLAHSWINPRLSEVMVSFTRGRGLPCTHKMMYSTMIRAPK